MMDGIYRDEDNSCLPLEKLNASIMHHPNEAIINLSAQLNDSTPINKSNEPTPSLRLRLHRRIALVKSEGFLIDQFKPQQGNQLNKDYNNATTLTLPQASHQVIHNNNNCLHKAYCYLSAYRQSLLNTYISIAFTLLALFSVDCKLIFIPASMENGFTIYYIIVIFYFILEMILNAICIQSYILSFYALLDFICIVFMVLEIENCIAYIGNMFTIEFEGYGSIYPDHNQIEKYVRIIRIFRMLNVVKLYYSTITIIRYVILKKKMRQIEKIKRKSMEKKRKAIDEKRNKRTLSSKTLKNFNLPIIINNKSMLRNNDKNSSVIKSTIKKKETENSTRAPSSFAILNKTSILSLGQKGNNIKKTASGSSSMAPLASGSGLTSSSPASLNFFKEQKINTVITARTNQKIILIIVIIYFLNPLTDDTLILCPYDLTFNIFTRFIDTTHNDNSFLPENQGKQLDYLFENMTIGKYSIINASYEDISLYVNDTMQNESFRSEEIGYAFLPPGKGLITFSLKKKCQVRSFVALFRAIFTYILLLLFSTSLSKDAERLLLNPLKDMIGIVDVVAKDPINSKLIEDIKKSCQNSIENIKKKHQSSNFEIKIIQFAVIRISALLAIGFGEAGGEILKENIQSSEGLNPMLQGKRIEAIFGFCYIRNFAEINEVLQEKIMIFVNKISEIVHTAVDKFGGITNKNLGDCFLLIWKLKDNDKDKDQNRNYNQLANIAEGDDTSSDKPTTVIEEDRRSHQSDEALLAFLSIIKKINKSEPILSYRKNQDLIDRLGKGFKVQMGFGLHIGWGIEGAIGSFYKIDCSYLSPNVNIAARLETATNIYGVDILFSGEFYETLSTFMKRLCRHIDVVALKGCVTPVKLYTVDINSNLHQGKAKYSNKKFNIRERRLKKAKLRNVYDSDMTKTIGEIYLSRSKGMRNLLHKTKTEAFLNYFDEGFNGYIDGDWDEAYANLKNALYLDKNDGPTKTLLAYMKKNNRKPPDDWDGFRKLEAKS